MRAETTRKLTLHTKDLSSETHPDKIDPQNVFKKLEGYFLDVAGPNNTKYYALNALLTAVEEPNRYPDFQRFDSGFAKTHDDRDINMPNIETAKPNKKHHDNDYETSFEFLDQAYKGLLEHFKKEHSKNPKSDAIRALQEHKYNIERFAHTNNRELKESLDAYVTKIKPKTPGHEALTDIIDKLQAQQTLMIQTTDTRKIDPNDYNASKKVYYSYEESKFPEVSTEKLIEKIRGIKESIKTKQEESTEYAEASSFFHNTACAMVSSFNQYGEIFPFKKAADVLDYRLRHLPEYSSEKTIFEMAEHALTKKDPRDPETIKNDLKDFMNDSKAGDTKYQALVDEIQELVIYNELIEEGNRLGIPFNKISAFEADLAYIIKIQEEKTEELPGYREARIKCKESVLEMENYLSRQKDLSSEESRLQIINLLTDQKLSIHIRQIFKK